ncbi:MAG: hypothetical protein PHY16_04620 [Methylobacter sp.]|nr:hypothetical protein [Methylobacter sp.]
MISKDLQLNQDNVIPAEPALVRDSLSIHRHSGRNHWQKRVQISSYRQGMPVSRLQGCECGAVRLPWPLDSGAPCRYDGVMGTGAA